MDDDFIAVRRDLLERLAPPQPINQDERGGCVWCGGRPSWDSYEPAEANPDHHEPDCPWLAARRAIGDDL